MTDQTKMALPAARRLLGLGARMGAAQVLFYAAIQRQAAEVTNLPQRPFGRRVKPQPKPHAANDHTSTPEKPSGTVA